MRSALLFVKGLLETARSFEAVDPVVCEHHALDDALRHESLDHDERFKQQVVTRGSVVSRSSSEPSQFRESCGFRKVSHEQLELAIRPASLIAFQPLGLRSSLPFVLNNLRLSVTLCIAEQKTALSNVTICNR